MPYAMMMLPLPRALLLMLLAAIDAAAMLSPPYVAFPLYFADITISSPLSLSSRFFRCRRLRRRRYLPLLMPRLPPPYRNTLRFSRHTARRF